MTYGLKFDIIVCAATTWGLLLESVFAILGRPVGAGDLEYEKRPPLDFHQAVVWNGGAEHAISEHEIVAVFCPEMLKVKTIRLPFSPSS